MLGLRLLLVLLSDLAFWRENQGLRANFSQLNSPYAQGLNAWDEERFKIVVAIA